MTLDDLFRIGDYVTVDNSALAWIAEKKYIDNTIVFKVRYELTNFHEDNVTMSRINVVNYSELSNNNRQNRQINVLPNNIRTSSDSSSSDNTNNNNISSTNPSSQIRIPMLQHFHKCLETAYTFKPYHKDVNMHLFTFLKDEKKQRKGLVEGYNCK